MAIRPVLNRFEIVTYGQNVVGSPPYPWILCPGTIAFYRQGATVDQNDTFAAGAVRPLLVKHPGAIQYFSVVADRDIVQLNHFTEKRFRVEGITPADPRSDPDGVQLNLNNISTAPIVVAPGDRLVLTTRLPTICDDPSGGVPRAGNSITTDAVTARGGCYVDAPRYDYVLSGVNIPFFVGRDLEGGLAMRVR